MRCAVTLSSEKSICRCITFCGIMRLTYDGIPDRFDAESILKYGSNLPRCRIVWHLRNMPEYGADSTRYHGFCKRGEFLW